VKIFVAILLIILAPSLYAESNIVGKARENGMVECLPSAQRVADYLEDGNTGTHTIWFTGNPEFISATVAQKFQNGTPNIYTAVVMKQNDECAIKITSVTTYRESCAAVVPKYMKDAEFGGTLQDVVTVLDVEGTNRYLAASENGGCVSVKVETLWDDIATKQSK
jgi:hypothetical protein